MWVALTLARQVRATGPGQDPPWQDRGLVLGAALGLVLLLLHSAADYPLRTLSLAGYAALLACLSLGSNALRIDKRLQ